MLTPFQCLSPEWAIPGENACTILDTSEDGTPGQFHMDIYQIAKLQLLKAGVSPKHISGAQWNTFTNPLLHSARREGEHSGRMATIVWME